MFNGVPCDVPSKKSNLVSGEYELDRAPSDANAAGKIIHMPGEGKIEFSRLHMSYHVLHLNRVLEASRTG
jgi:hypothetical protein